MSEYARDNAQKIENFKLEINEELNDIKERIGAVRVKINDNRGFQENFSGFLCGHVADYLDKFDAQIEKMNTRLAQDQEYWT